MASSLESNKIAAAVLTAGVIAMMAGFVADLVYHPHVELEEDSYPIAAAPEGGAGEAPAQEEETLQPIAPLLAAADLAAGETLASRQCASCHTFEEGGANKVGPNLYGVVGNPIAAHEGFAYSSALAERSSETWDYEHLAAFLHAPRDFAPGTKMTFRGFSDAEDLANVVAYLRTLDANPEPLPEVTAEPAAEGGAEQPAAEGGTEQPAAEGGTEQPAEGGTEGQTETAPEQPASEQPAQ